MSFEDLKLSNFKCPECGNKAVGITHRFRPPKVDEKRKWDVVSFLIGNGFLYQHISIYQPDTHGIQRFIGYAQYPENMIDAIEFIKKYKDHVQHVKTDY